MDAMIVGENVVTVQNLLTVREHNLPLRAQRERPIVGHVVSVADDGQSGYVEFLDPETGLPQRVFFSAAELEPADGVDDGY